MPAAIHDPARILLVTAAEVRNFTGVNANADASDAVIQQLIRHAQSILIGGLTMHVINLELDGPIDGSNTLYEIPRGRRARVLFDDNLDEGATSDALLQSMTGSDGADPPTFATLTASSVDAINGQITLTTAPAATVDAVLYTGRLTTRRLDKEALKTAILCRTALALDARVRERGKVNLTNPEASKKGGGDPHGLRSEWKAMLAEAMRSLRRVVPGKASVETRLRRSTSSTSPEGAILDP